MNRNVESRFAYNPTNIDMKRSRFDRSFSVKTSFNVGQLIPFCVEEVLPGDTFDVTTSKVARLQTLLTPMMDNLYLDTYWFFVPNRLVWQHWKEFNGENTAGYWTQQIEYSIPQMCPPSGSGFAAGSVADYFGLPVGVEDISVSALPFRAYGLIYNEWFRDENLIQPDNVPLDDSTAYQSATSGSPRNYKTFPYRVSKYHDYFTSCLPSPQKGPDVTIPLAFADDAPVVSGGNHPEFLVQDGYTGGAFYTLYAGTAVSGNHSLYTNNGTLRTDRADYTVDSYSGVYPSNLWASLDGISGAATINELRLAFQIQKLYEKDARGGTRYVEILKSHFGVTSPDYRLQRPEYLGGNRIPININQIIQQSETTETSPLGATAAMSLTSDVHGDFVKSFTEHGYIIGLVVARYDHTYQQGIERHFSRKTRFDYYWPVLANIGEMAVLNKEIYATGTDVDDEVFGYQEAWADYRYKPSRVTGEMRSDAALSLDVWHLADDYDSVPALSKAWIEEDKNTVDRVLAVTSQVSNQIFMDIYVKNWATRPMPLYSIPGLIDHH